jgi:hypothetical protein
LVADLPLWKIWLCQRGWWHSQYMENQKIHVPNHQPAISWLIIVWFPRSCRWLVGFFKATAMIVIHLSMILFPRTTAIRSQKSYYFQRPCMIKMTKWHILMTSNLNEISFQKSPTSHPFSRTKRPSFPPWPWPPHFGRGSNKRSLRSIGSWTLSTCWNSVIMSRRLFSKAQIGSKSMVLKPLNWLKQRLNGRWINEEMWNVVNPNKTSGIRPAKLV